MHTPIYNLNEVEGYNMLQEQLSSTNYAVGWMFNNFFHIKKDEQQNFVVEKDIVNIGMVSEASDDLFDAMIKIVNKYNL